MASQQKNENRRLEIIAAAATHLVDHGFQNSGLRAIAKSAGISDRMIMYYFETKEELVSEALSLIGESLADGMDKSVPNGNLSPRQLLDELSDALKSEEVQAALRLWFEIVGLAMRGQQPYQKTAALLLLRSQEQIRKKLRSDQKHRAREVLSTLEGQMMIDLLLT